MKNTALSFHELPAQPKSWSRYGSAAFVVALHIDAIWALALGLGVNIGIPISPGPVITRVIDAVQKPPPQKNIPQPAMKSVPLPYVPAPVIVVAPESGAAALQTSAQPAPQQPSAVPDSPATAVGATHGAPPYPALARRLGQQGSVILLLNVGTDGAVTDAQIANSSGSTELDTAAVDWVKAHWRYKPAIRNGVVVAGTAKAEVRFDLKQAQ